jgi:hypothetical protein
MKMLFSRWNNAPASMRRRLAPPAILLEKHAPPHDGNAAFPDTPSSPCQRSKTFAARPKAYEANCVFTRSYGAALGALFCTRRSRRNSRAPAALDTNDAWRRSVVGGGERNRTDDLLLAKQALSQLSYTPKVLGGSPPKILGGVSACPCNRESRAAQNKTPSQILQARYSMPRRRRALVRSLFLHQAALGATHVAPAAATRTTLRVVRSWWAREDLNLRPHAYQARALTN